MEQDALINIALYTGYGLVALAAVCTIILPLINSISNPKQLITPALGVIFLGIVYLISYSMAGNEVTQTYANFNVDSEASVIIGGALKAMYILVGIALFGIIFTEITKIFK